MLRPGDMMGGYAISSLLGRGGMASVYLARLAGVGGFQRFVAIKRLHAHYAKDPMFVRMFQDEARLAGRVTPIGSRRSRSRCPR